MRRGSSQPCWGLALLATLSSVGARAGEKPPKVVVIHLVTDPAGPGQAADAAVAKRLGEEGFDCVFRDAAPTSCEQGGCLAQLASGSGAGLLLRASLAPQDAGGTLTLTLFDPSGQPAAEISKVLADRSAASLGDAIEEALPKLVQPFRNAVPVPPPGTAENESPPPVHSHTAAFALMASGAALLLGSGAVGYAADSADASLENAVNGSAPGNIPALRSSVATEAWVSTGLTLAGVATIVVGVVLFYARGSSGPALGQASAGAPTLAWGF